MTRTDFKTADANATRLGLPKTRVHGLRRANGTYLSAAGVDPRTQRERMEHHAPGFTMKVYTHATTAGQLRAAETANALLLHRPKQAEVH